MTSQKRDPVVLLLSRAPGMKFLYGVLRVSAPIWMGGLVVLPFFTGVFQGPSPLEWRAFASSVTSHHTVILWGYSALFFALWLKAKVDPVIAVAAVFMVISVHELFWWAFDSIIVSQVFGYTFHWYWLFGYLLPPTFGCFVIYPQLLKFPRALVLAVFFFDFAWALAGWPVTVNYVGGVYPAGSPLQGMSVWYGTLWGDGWEAASWGVPMAAFWVFCRKELTDAQSLLTKSLVSGKP